jgi:hypothetical protein
MLNNSMTYSQLPSFAHSGIVLSKLILDGITSSTCNLDESYYQIKD